MEVDNAVGICAGDKRCHGNDILGIVVLDGTQIAKLPLSCNIIGNKVRGLYIDPLSFRLLADKVNRTHLKLAYADCIPHAQQLVIDDILQRQYFCLL